MGLFAAPFADAETHEIKIGDSFKPSGNRWTIGPLPTDKVGVIFGRGRFTQVCKELDSWSPIPSVEPDKPGDVATLKVSVLKQDGTPVETRQMDLREPSYLSFDETVTVLVEYVGQAGAGPCFSDQGIAVYLTTIPK